MERNTLLVLLSAFIILFCSTLVSAQGTDTPWSQWACFNNTAATRSRTVQNCTDMEFTDPMTNMTTTNTTCVDVIDVEIRTDVVSANTWSDWGPVVSCGMTGTVTQTRTSSCQTADFPCSSVCTGGRTTERTVTVPLCCEQQNVSLWSSWAPGCSPSAPVQQSRERMYLPCDPGIVCEMNCSSDIDTRIIAQTSWGDWGEWSSTQVPMCGTGQRSRQRTCTNTSLVYCNIDCMFGSNNTGYQCCVANNVWSTWSTWSQPTTTGPCPATRTRTRSCVVDLSVTVNASQPSCEGTCVLNSVDQLKEPVDTQRCAINGTLASSTGDDNGFPTWAIGLISAIGVIIAIGGFVALTIVGRYLTRRREYSIGEAAKAAQREYERMNEGTAPSAYQPTTTSFTYNPEGIPGTTASESLKYTEPFDEKQF